ncbi:HesA/MoeB/ThiF family protein [Magnetococcus sp. PR-3]|uniref:HesA/MoeB/ThiF family protein n=1 Tax=Magnetococcus sp. PR-3 TaxID=3120355 RepID=UPI002FCE5A83
MDFTETQINRYARHIILDGVGGGGQQRLLQAHVVVMGRGPAWANAILYLVAAGVGRLTLLQHQPLHTITSVEAVTGLPPGASVTQLPEQLAQLNPDCTVCLHDHVPDDCDGVLGFDGAQCTLGRVPWQLWVQQKGAQVLLSPSPIEAICSDPSPSTSPLVALHGHRLGSVAASEAIKALLMDQPPGAIELAL